MSMEDKENHNMEEQKGEQAKPGNPQTTFLLGIIAFLLICILVLIFLLTSKNGSSTVDSSEALQQNITDYANEQNVDSQERPALPVEAEVIIVEPFEAEDEETENEVVVSGTKDQSVILVEEENENDISYTKEYIFSEMLPFFENNNLDAVWDLAHLKRYVKLSEELKGTDTYYYQGGVDSDGLPDGTGLAIYENNTYYYGGWSHGLRSGDGRWYRYYINASNKVTKNKKYLAHSYAGQWSNDLPNGEGVEHFDVDVDKLEAGERILQNVVGNFTDGLYDGEMYANTIDYRNNEEEWDGIAKKGVFDLWRDMSSIGECSVWRKKNDMQVYMDIQKKENKNQGLQELINVVSGT